MKTTRNELKLRADKCPIKRFKAFIGKANTQATLCADTGIEIIGWSGFDASDLNAKSHRVELARFIAAADPETILALLAELVAKDTRIAELEGQLHSGFTPEALAQEERAENAEQRVAELEEVATDYAGKFQKAQDAAKHLIIMINDAKKRITELEAEGKVWESAALKHLERAEEAEKRLATPKPPEKCPTCNRRYTLESYAHGECAICGDPFDADDALRAMGFTVEGDE